jgi:hypothetical protein
MGGVHNLHGRDDKANLFVSHSVFCAEMLLQNDEANFFFFI